MKMQLANSEHLINFPLILHVDLLEYASTVTLRSFHVPTPREFHRIGGINNIFFRNRFYMIYEF